MWNLYTGELKLHLWNGTSDDPISIVLSDVENCYCYVVPAGWWQAVEPIAGDVLVGCSVGPGFEFEDYLFITKDSDEANTLKEFSTEFQRFI